MSFLIPLVVLVAIVLPVLLGERARREAHRDRAAAIRELQAITREIKRLR